MIIPAVVRDRDGKAVPGLTREDFRVVEDGKNRPIIHVDIEQQSGSIGTSFPRQYDAYLFDDLHLDLREIEPARTAFENHLRELSLMGRRVAVFTTSGRVYTPFTNSSEVLLEAARAIRPVPGARTGNECPDISYFLADQISRRRDPAAIGAVVNQLAACMPNLPFRLARHIAEAEATNILRIESAAVKSALSVMQRAVTEMERLPGTRNMVLISSGFHMADAKERQALSHILTQAGRHRVTVSAVNAHGVHGTSVDVSHKRISNIPTAAGFRDAADWLAEAAGETGGTYIGNFNDIKAGLSLVSRPSEYVYQLAIRTADPPLPGKVHTIQVKLHGRPGLSVQAQRRYEEIAPLSPSDQIRAVLFSGSEIQQLELALQSESTPGGKLRVAAGVGGRDLPLQERGALYSNSVVIAYGVFDENGNLAGESVRVLDLNLKAPAVTKLRAEGIRLGAEFEVKPGTYLVRVAVREAETGRVSAVGRLLTFAP